MPIVKKTERGFALHSYNTGPKKLMVVDRSCGDVSELIGHEVRVVGVVHDTRPDHAFRGVEFVRVEHDFEQCKISAECSRARRKSQLQTALEIAEALEAKAEKTPADRFNNGPRERMLRIAAEIRENVALFTDEYGEPVMDYWNSDRVSGLPMRARGDFLGIPPDWEK